MMIDRIVACGVLLMINRAGPTSGYLAIMLCVGMWKLDGILIYTDHG